MPRKKPIKAFIKELKENNFNVDVALKNVGTTSNPDTLRRKRWDWLHDPNVLHALAVEVRKTQLTAEDIQEICKYRLLGLLVSDKTKPSDVVASVGALGKVAGFSTGDEQVAITINTVEGADVLLAKRRKLLTDNELQQSMSDNVCYVNSNESPPSTKLSTSYPQAVDKINPKEEEGFTPHPVPLYNNNTVHEISTKNETVSNDKKLDTGDGSCTQTPDNVADSDIESKGNISEGSINETP